MLLSGTKACHFSVRQATSLVYPMSCALFKRFNTKSSEIFENCKLAFGLRPFALTIAFRKRHLYNNFANNNNTNAVCQIYCCLLSVNRLRPTKQYLLNINRWYGILLTSFCHYIVILTSLFSIMYD